MTRTDIHRPSAIKPEEYEFVGLEYQRPIDFWITTVENERARIKAHKERTGGKFADHEHGGTCMVCGAHAIYTALFHHRLTNVYVRTGLDCAAKIEMSMNHDAANRFRAAVQDARKAQAGKKKAQALLGDKGLTSAWNIYNDLENNPALRNAAGREETTIHDIVGKLIKYGSVSEKQENFVRTLLDRITNRPIVAQQRAVEIAAAAPVPTGRVVVEGVIISTKVVESAYSRGGTLKMLVKSDTGFKVWGTAPLALNGKLAGTRIKFTATVEPSKDDPKFGFFKRPVVITHIPQETK